MCIRINRNRMTAVDGDEPNGAGTQPNQLTRRAILCDKDGFITAGDGFGLTAQRLERGRTHEPAGNINVPSGIEREVVGGIVTGATRLQYPKQLTVALVLGKKNVAAASGGKGLASEVGDGGKRTGDVMFAILGNPDGGTSVRSAATEAHSVFPAWCQLSLGSDHDHKEGHQTKQHALRIAANNYRLRKRHGGPPGFPLERGKAGTKLYARIRWKGAQRVAQSRQCQTMSPAAAAELQRPAEQKRCWSGKQTRGTRERQGKRRACAWSISDTDYECTAGFYPYSSFLFYDAVIFPLVTA